MRQILDCLINQQKAGFTPLGSLLILLLSVIEKYTNPEIAGRKATKEHQVKNIYALYLSIQFNYYFRSLDFLKFSLKIYFISVEEGDLRERNFQIQGFNKTSTVLITPKPVRC